MAGQAGESSFNLKADLLKRGHSFSFFQVMRLLRLLVQEAERSPKEETYALENVKIRPELSLAFPAADVAKIEEISGAKPHFRVMVTFLGLYGSSSPLPIFYTEDLIDEAVEDRSATRDFIDIIHHRLYPLLFQCFTKYRQFLRVVEEESPQDLEKLFCLLGLGEKELRENLPDAYSFLRYIGLFTQFPRSSAGLQAMAGDALEGAPVEVISCLKRKVKIPPEQRMYLGISGNSLGEDSFLGEEIEDRMGKIALQIGPLRREQFHSLFPGNAKHQRLAVLTRLYLTDPIECDLRLILAEREAETVCLGIPRWSRLGWDTWVFSGDSTGEVKASFPLQKI